MENSYLYFLVIIIYIFVFVVVIGYLYKNRILGKKSSYDQFIHDIEMNLEKYEEIRNAIRKNQNEELSYTDITVINEYLNCENCGADIYLDDIEIESNFVFVTCDYCHAVYYMKKNMKR